MKPLLIDFWLEDESWNCESFQRFIKFNLNSLKNNKEYQKIVSRLKRALRKVKI